mmetsp:Transcript_16437/g.20529  ORF Transcript_16437/g.20529 Transcript_16437/m.20529 type:complete len:329 (+) Transcript_16437:135-1121(+)|eukprot:CAMPEP_0172517534 /NCGR_PEP_ID=MMETSP1066-20121228/285905_1 /TAXON_ID=671091 /ORGANISM="Coscinodiscus wailesii, Strain CCMP2513" /LENGTH=328 /DNA_ID=CAMNT_0013299583 /DNA_START=112 /DNA_END=1098 /DNA_ORIENTATION=-
MKNPFKKGIRSNSSIGEKGEKPPTRFTNIYSCGSTIPRAPPFGDVADAVEQHGANSPAAVRAMAAVPVKDAHIPLPHSFWNADASNFELRVGPNYNKKKRKEPSGPALYDLYGMEIVKSEEGILNEVRDGFEIPDVPGLTDIDTGHPYVPPMIVLNCNLPCEEPDMLKTSSDGPTYIAVIYLVISPSTLEELMDLETASPAVKLFAEWCEKSETDADFRGRFKAMCVLDDVDKLGLPSFITGYNGKPTLITKSGNFTRYPNYIEMSINVHMFAYLAKKGLYTLHKKFPTFVLNVGFTIEARDDSQMPEVLLGGCRVLNLDLAKVQVAS